MPRLIDADALKKDKTFLWDEVLGTCECVLVEDIDNAPTIETEPAKHGRWISFLDGDHIMPARYYKCSRCGRVEYRQEPYCHCGAKMDGGAENGGQ